MRQDILCQQAAGDHGHRNFNEVPQYIGRKCREDHVQYGIERKFGRQCISRDAVQKRHTCILCPEGMGLLHHPELRNEQIHIIMHSNIAVFALKEIKYENSYEKNSCANTVPVLLKHFHMSSLPAKQI